VLAKPFSYLELRPRVHALLRRAEAPRRDGLQIGALTVDTVARDIRMAGTPITLAGKEYALLVHLAADPTRVFSEHELLRDVWGYQSRSATRTLDSHACRLRRKLTDASPIGARWVENV
jgi:DNA-binding response OmpR family regulator